MHPFGGRQRFVLRLTSALQSDGHRVRIYALAWQGPLPEGVDLCLVPVRALRRHKRERRFSQWVHRDLETRPVDGVLGFQPMPGLDAYVAVESCFLDMAQRERSAWYRRTAAYRHYLACERSVFCPPATTHVFLHSEEQGQGFVQRYGTQVQNLESIPPAVAQDRFAGPDAAARRQRTREAFGLDQREITFLLVGTPFRDKGLARALRAMASLRRTVPNAETRLLVVGGERPGSHSRLARRLGVADAVQFLGPRGDVPDLLLAADLLVHPAASEAGGLVVLEAMAAGLPVLTTATTGYAPLVARAGAGVVLREPFSQRAMDESLQQFLRSDFRAACSQAGHRYAMAEDLSSGCEHVAKRLVALFGSPHEC